MIKVVIDTSVVISAALSPNGISFYIMVFIADDEIVIALNGKVLERNIPLKKLKLIEAWIMLHEDDFIANWKLLSDGDRYFKIDPLK